VFLYCAQKRVTSIAGNVPFWLPSQVIVLLFTYYVFVVMTNKLCLFPLQPTKGSGGAS